MSMESTTSTVPTDLTYLRYGSRLVNASLMFSGIQRQVRYLKVMRNSTFGIHWFHAQVGNREI